MTPASPRRILVTGYAGFAGRHLIRALRRHPVSIIGLDRLDPAAASDDGEPDAAHVGDLVDVSFVRQLIADTRPDVVFHLAAMTFGRPAGPLDRRFFEVNVDGTRNLLEALLAAELSSRVLITGSSAAYGAPPDPSRPIDESAPLAPQTLYAASKVCQEIIALTYHRTHGLPVVVTRAFNHPGPGEHPHFAASAFARQIAEIEAGHATPPLRVGNLESYRDFLDVRDVVRAYIIAAFDGIPGECYNVCSGTARRMSDVLGGLLELTDHAITVERDPERMQPSDVPYQCGSPAKLTAQTGWQPEIPFSRTLRDLLDGWRAQIAAHDRAVSEAKEGR